MHTRKDRYIRRIPLSTETAYMNMATDEYLFYSKEADVTPILRFYMWNPSSATIGRNQSMDAEVDIDYSNSNGINYTRRITGGGAVLHSSLNELTYMFVSPKKILNQAYSRLIKEGLYHSDDIPRYYVPILQSLIVGLSELGLTLDINKMHCPALMVSGKKISGNSQAMRSEVVLQHGTLLLKIDPEEMYSVLKVPESKTKKNIVLSVKAKVGALHEFLSSDDVSIETLCTHLTNGFSKVFMSEIKDEQLSETELNEILKLAERYRSGEWIFRK